MMEMKRETSTLTVVLQFVEQLARPVGVVAGAIYVIGYIVTAARLASYGIFGIKFFDAQYLAAGLIPGFILLVTAVVVISAFHHNPLRPTGEKSSAWKWAHVVFWVPVGVMIIAIFLFREWFDEFWVKAKFVNMPIAFVLGEFAMWILIVGFKNKIITSWFKGRSLGVFSIILSIGYIMYLLIFALIALILMPLVGIQMYAEVPQAYGGGKLLAVELYVDPVKVPRELLADRPKAEALNPARTRPLDLLFRTSDEYIVAVPEYGNRRAWVIDAAAVHTVTTQATTSAGP